MQLETVESDVIHAVGYDSEIHLLEIIFNDGAIYQYRDVPREVFEGIMGAESKGQYFHQNIRDEFQYWRYDRAASEIVRSEQDRNARTTSDQ